MSIPFRRRPGRWAARSAALAAALAFGAACNYGFQGGGGFPADIRSLYVSTFENETPQFDLDQQIFRSIQDRVPRALGIRPAGRDIADAVITGKIVRYEDVAQNYQAGGADRSTQVLTHQVRITVSAQIVDVERNLILWESTSIQGQGEYRLDTQTVDTGRDIAVDQIVQKIIDGAQSQW